MPKKFKLFGIALLAISSVLCLVGCNDQGSTEKTPVEPTVQPSQGGEQTGGEQTGGGQEEETKIIKSLVAKNETVTVRVDENKSLSTYYTLTGYKSLSAAQKKCTYTSSDESVVKIANTLFKALKPGTATITVTSKVDTTMSCTFTVVVKDVFFDRAISKVSPDDNVECELLEDGGYIVTSENIQGEYLVKGVESTKLLISADITFNKASASELYPKCGICFSTTDKTNPTDNKIYFFLNSEIGSDNRSSWTDFGVCEVQNGGNWAWNPGVTDANARHKNALYQVPEAITYGTTFNLTVARDGYDFHVWVNGVYAGSCTTLEDLFGATSESGWAPAPSYAGFFQFNSEVKFEKYSISQDAAVVDAKIAEIAEKVYIAADGWDKDAA